MMLWFSVGCTVGAVVLSFVAFPSMTWLQAVTVVLAFNGGRFLGWWEHAKGLRRSAPRQEGRA